jgi:hypothetical protein
MTEADTGTQSKPERITRTRAIALLKDLREHEPHAMFSAEWVAVGDAKSGPFLCRKTLRFQVKQYLKGGSLSYNPAEQGYMTVFEMVNRNRAIKLYKEGATKALEELQAAAVTQQQTLDRHQQDFEQRESEARAAVVAVGAAETGAYATKTAKRKAVSKATSAKRSAESQLKRARQLRDRAVTNRDELAGKIRFAQLKIADPEAALRQSISAAIERFSTKLSNETDAGERERLTARIELERANLEDPIQELMCRYRTLNLNGLISLKIHGQVYEITTPPVPAVPENAIVED